MQKVERHGPYSLFAILAAAALFVVSGACARSAGGPGPANEPGAAAPEAKPWHLTVLHFNDFHGHLEPPGGDGARLATVISQARAESIVRGAPVILLFAGDACRDCGLSGRTKGGSDVLFFNEESVDASAVGNHEFDFGLDAFRFLRGLAHFPYLAANIRQDSPESPLVDPSAVVDLRDLGGPSIALIGLTTTDAPTTTRPENVAGLKFGDPVEAARGELARSDVAMTDVQIAITHLGFDGDCRVSCEVRDLDLIVGGHNHFAFEKARLGGHAPIVQAGSGGRYLGRVEMAGVGSRVTSVVSGLLPVTADTPEDPAVRERIQNMERILLSGPDEPVGTLAARLDGEQEEVRRRETNFGDLLADLIRERAGADVAIVNGGAIRNSIDGGIVTANAVRCALPFRDKLVVLALTGAELRAVIERSASLDPLANPGGFLQMSGMQARIDGSRLVLANVAGEPLDAARTYRVATTGFLADGGDGYEALKSRPPVSEIAVSLADLLTERLKVAGALTPTSGGRIAIKGRPGLAEEVPQACSCERPPAGARKPENAEG